MSIVRKTVELKGIGVSPGVAMGPVFLLKATDDRIVERNLPNDEAEFQHEEQRLEEALIATRDQIHEIQENVSTVMGDDHAQIFDAHLQVVDDQAVLTEIYRYIREHRKNVEVAVYEVTEHYARVMAGMKDDYLRERATDIRDVRRRVLRNLAGHGSETLSDLKEPCIIVAKDISPSETAMFNRSKILGFVTDLGSPTSHTAIMAKGLELPAVVAARDVSVRVTEGTRVILDGTRGMLYLNPTEELEEKYEKIAQNRNRIKEKIEELQHQPAATLDGYQVELSANIELPTDVDMVLSRGAAGVGLFRSEYLYLTTNSLPTEEQQFTAYSEVARRLGNAPVIIRTVDLGGDKFISETKNPDELNPFMGWRAIRFCLAQPDVFKTQLRAILRASAFGNVKLMYPMISKVDEVLQANVMLEECKAELEAKGVAFNRDIEVGVMIEIPSAVLTAHLIAPHVKFFSIGTNDLAQYTLAVDRVNERIAYLYEPTHPAIIHLIRQTVEVGHQHGIWVGVCGEMAGNPMMVPLLLGLGVDELSVSPVAIPLIKTVIRQMRYSDAECIAEDALKADSGAEILKDCHDLVSRVAPEVLEIVE